MTTKYVLEPENEEFTVGKPDDCMIEVSKNGHTARITVDGANGFYVVTVDNGPEAARTRKADGLVDYACREILRKLAAIPTEKALCSGLDALYAKISKGEKT